MPRINPIKRMFREARNKSASIPTARQIERNAEQCDLLISEIESQQHVSGSFRYQTPTDLQRRRDDAQCALLLGALR